ncbi:MAG: YidC/Oxa1 family membrane protein insertase [Acidimicrobiales bacterium]
MFFLLAAGSLLDPLYNALGSVLAAFYAVVPSYGVAIILLTLTVRAVLIPLTAKQVKSQQAMQRMQPELKRLQTKHKGDRVKLNEEMMKFYKEHNFNPLAGCLPVLLQAPLFIVLYRLVHDLGSRPPKHLPAGSLIEDRLLDSAGKMISWGIDLGQKASDVKGLGNALPFYLMVALVVGTGYYQQRQLSSRLPQGAANAQMQMIGKVFPVFIGLISLSIPAGVVVYFIVSNFWQIAQQAVTFRSQGPVATAEAGRRADKAAALEDDRKAKGQKGPGQAAVNRKAKPGRATPKTSNTKPAPSSKGSKRPPPSPRPKGLPRAGGNPKAPRGAPGKDS